MPQGPITRNGHKQRKLTGVLALYRVREGLAKDHFCPTGGLRWADRIGVG